MSNLENIPSKVGISNKLAAIDAIRGYAVLLVIMSHAGGRMPELVWPLKKLTNMGWYGVQLFFIASAVTLMMSWSKSEGKQFKNRVIQFFKRRYFRIAPMYYFAALLYFFLRPPGDKFSFELLFANLAFLNAWEPNWMPVTPVWQVVPGGWSIGVEFSFYAVFPFMALVCSNLRRTLVLLGFSLCLMVISRALASYFFPSLNEVEMDNFAYFWLPNQLVIFALGFMGYWILTTENELWSGFRRWLSLKVYLIFGATITVIFFVAQLGVGKFMGTQFPWIPNHLILGITFMLAVIALIEHPASILVMPMVRRIGQYSFSGYCLHFGILDLLPRLSGNIVNVNAAGIDSVWNFFLLMLATVILTFLLSTVTFRLIEAPFIRLGHIQFKSLR